ncbi:glycoside hydrolase family 15 protein [Sinomonas mesophila]|uniref:glycoside hydrolase family 15 protein n=1 Tax=Sinomonas mesophila TaxID=1531955 RepID=UPI0009875DEA|nr:glycoside hydrolase family 15 protein [Sinomonas mesophila]
MTLTTAGSIELLLSAQNATGAIPASPVHDVYQYGWLRDGSWCAYALQRAGQADAASRWHHWVAATLLSHRHRFAEATDAVRNGVITGRSMLPARFTLEGSEEPQGESEEEWPNFQTDCYGFWLWALADHLTHGGELDDVLRDASELVVGYLLVAGETPCFDCWEEHPGNVHTSSLAAVAAGLRDMGALLQDEAAQRYALQLLQRITGPEHVLGGAFIRFPGDTCVDGSLLWLAIPFNLVTVDDPLFQNTLSRIRDELLVPDGGLRRYLGDTFYGGSEWILLAATYGWVAVASGDRATAGRMLDWIEAAATPEGLLPEQVQNHVQSPYMLEFWRRRWGATATPLLWSHAMHIVLREELGSKR